MICPPGGPDAMSLVQTASAVSVAISSMRSNTTLPAASWITCTTSGESGCGPVAALGALPRTTAQEEELLLAATCVSTGWDCPLLFSPLALPFFSFLVSCVSRDWAAAEDWGGCEPKVCDAGCACVERACEPLAVWCWAAPAPEALAGAPCPLVSLAGCARSTLLLFPLLTTSKPAFLSKARAAEYSVGVSGMVKVPLMATARGSQRGSVA